MRFLLILGLVVFVALYLYGAALIAWTWWLSRRPVLPATGDAKTPSDVPDHPRTHAA